MRELWDQKTGLAVALLVAVLAATSVLYKISVVPPGLESKSVGLASASTEVIVDTRRPAVVDLREDTYSFQALTNRALLLGNVMASPPVRAYIGRRAGVSADRIRVEAPVTPEQPRVVADGAHQPKTSDILRSPDEYRISIQADPTVPVLSIYAEAPDAVTAEKLADASVGGLRDYLHALAKNKKTPPKDEVKLNQLGPAKGATINSGAGPALAAAVFVLVFLAVCLLAILLSRVRRGWRATRRAEPGPAHGAA